MVPPGEKYPMLYSATRPSKDKPFPAPRIVRELQNLDSAWNPSVSADGLTLYFDSRDENGINHIVSATRASRNAKWSQPKQVPINAQESKGR